MMKKQIQPSVAILALIVALCMSSSASYVFAVEQRANSASRFSMSGEASSMMPLKTYFFLPGDTDDSLSLSLSLSPLDSKLSLTPGPLIGLRFDFDIADSLALGVFAGASLLPVSDGGYLMSVPVLVTCTYAPGFPEVRFPISLGIGPVLQVHDGKGSVGLAGRFDVGMEPVLSEHVSIRCSVGLSVQAEFGKYQGKPAQSISLYLLPFGLSMIYSW